MYIFQKLLGNIEIDLCETILDELYRIIRKHRFRGRFPKGNKLLKRCFFPTHKLQKERHESKVNGRIRVPFYSLQVMP